MKNDRTTEVVLYHTITYFTHRAKPRWLCDEKFGPVRMEPPSERKAQCLPDDPLRPFAKGLAAARPSAA